MFSLFSFPAISTEFRKSMKLSLPLVASQLIYASNGFISTAMIAHLGRDELAANALVWSMFAALILFFIGVLSSVSILVSQSHGAKDHNGIKQATNQGLILAVLFAIPMMAIVFLAPKLLALTSQSPTIIAIATPYFHSLGWCMLPLNILIVLEQFLIGIGRTRPVLLISIIEVPLELVFFYTLLFGKFGMPKLGLPGVGYGFAITLSILAIALAFFVHQKGDLKKYCIFKKFWEINKKFLGELMRVGFPLGAMFCIEVSLFAVIAIMMGWLGNDVLAAHQIAYQCFIFTVEILFGISQGASIRIGYEVGRNNRDAVKLASYVNLGIGICIMLIPAFIYTLFPNAVIGIDLNIHNPKYQAVIEQAKIFLVIAALLQISDCFRIIFVSLLRGLKDTKGPMYISLIAFWGIAFPCGYLLAFKLHLAGAGIWWGLLIGITVAAMILVVRFNRLVDRVNLATMVTK